MQDPGSNAQTSLSPLFKPFPFSTSISAFNTGGNSQNSILQNRTSMIYLAAILDIEYGILSRKERYQTEDC